MSLLCKEMSTFPFQSFITLKYSNSHINVLTNFNLQSAKILLLRIYLKGLIGLYNEF